jgi:hypothetical protein
MRAARAERRRPSLEIDGPRLRQWGAGRLALLRVEMPPPSEEVFARESREFLEDLDAFIAAECAGRHGSDPVAFEVPFGFAPDDRDDEPLASRAPLVIPIDGRRRFVLHGRIDRVNRLAPRTYEVADYKSSFFRDAWQGVFAGGTRLQHAIYGAAARQLLQATDPGARVVRGTYLFPRVRGFGARKAFDAPSDDALREVLRDLADVIGGGAFAPADEGQSCRWCEFAAACHASNEAQVGVKVRDEDNAALAPYRRLRSHP